MSEIIIYFLIAASRRHPAWFLPAPADRTTWGSTIENRRLNETHACTACNSRARCAYIFEPPEVDDPRWMDLCPDDDRQLRIALDQLQHPHGNDMLEKATQLLDTVDALLGPRPIDAIAITALVRYAANVAAV